MTVHVILDEAPVPSSAPATPGPGAGDGSDDFGRRISAMLDQERHYLCRDYLRLKGGNKNKSSANNNGAVNAAGRAKMCRWIFHAVDRAGFRGETAVNAVTLMDRFASSETSARARRSRASLGEYQLVALTSLFVAIKTTEQIEIDAATMSLFMRGLYSAEAIVSCERDIFKSLQWKLNGPTTFQFVRVISDSLPESVAREVREKSQGQVEAATEDYACVILNRSVLAVGAVLNSLEGVPQGDFSSVERSEFVRKLSEAFGQDVIASPLIKAVRMRLLSRSSGKSIRDVPRAPKTSVPCSA